MKRLVLAKRKDGRYQLTWGGIVIRMTREELVRLAADIAEQLEVAHG